MKAHNIFKSILAFSLAVIAVTSCQEKMKGFGFTKGEAVKFSIGTEGSGLDTKAVYAGNTTTAGEKERINWEPGDMIRIYCDAVSEPLPMKYADYKVSEVLPSTTEVSKAHIECAGGVGLRWGTGSHTFYAGYPSPASSGIVEKIAKEESGTHIILNADLKSEQGYKDASSVEGSWTVTPDLKWMLMTAKAGPYSEDAGIPSGKDNVFLSFTPLTTAVQFTVTNGTSSAMPITKVMLISKTSKISGEFSVDLDASVSADGYLPTGGSPSGQEVSIDLSSKNISLAAGKSLTFTFFLAPTQDVDDLTFKFFNDGGKWMSTRLGYTDGSGVKFPRCKKTEVKGVMLPKGAQWTVKYGPAGEDAADAVTVVTSWNTGVVDNLDMKKKLIKFIDLGLPSGTKWANMNIGATAETGERSYGDYYAWGELSTKATYTITNYRWTSSFTKYNGTDKLYTLQAEDDVANKLLGGRCHIPTRTQFEELFDSAYTTSTWKTNYEGSGMNGYLVTSKLNGNTIFLPAAGLSSEEGVALKGTNGCYWSSTLNPTPGSSTPYPSCAIDLDFTQTLPPTIYVEGDNSERYLGQCIRAVEDPEAKPFMWVDLELPSGILWANMNIGSNIESDMGSYYAWGELSTKNSYTSANYNYDGDDPVLPPAYDIATQTYGADSHIPSLDNFLELFDSDNTTIDKNVSGSGYWIITSKRNGNSITLPISGYYSGSKWYVNYSPYWTNKKNSFAVKVYDLKNDFDTALSGYYGVVVRAVKEQ